MKTRAAVAWQAGAPPTLETVVLDGPRAGEMPVEIKAAGICHAETSTLSGADPEGLVPAIQGHEGTGLVVDVGPGVMSLTTGDHVFPLVTPACRRCKFGQHRETTQCQWVRRTQGRGPMLERASDLALHRQRHLGPSHRFRREHGRGHLQRQAGGCHVCGGGVQTRSVGSAAHPSPSLALTWSHANDTTKVRNGPQATT